MDYEEALKQKVDLRKLTSSASFAEEEIITAAMNQPRLYLDAVRLRVEANRFRQRMEMKFELVRSEMSREIRKTHVVKTEGHLKEILIRRRPYRKARREYEEAVVREQFFEKLTKMMDMRMQSIRVVSSLMGAEKNVESRRLAEQAGHRERESVRQDAEKKYKKHRHRH